MTMRALHVIPSLSLLSGGPTVALMGLAAGQRRAGLDVSLVVTFRADESDDTARTLETEGVCVTRVGPATGRLVRHPDLSAAVRDAVGAADVVHIHALYEEVQHLAAYWARAMGKPYVIRPCGMLHAWSLQRHSLKKRLYMAWRLRKMLARAAAIHFTTSHERNGSDHLQLKARAIIEPNGVELAEYDSLPPGGLFRERFHIPCTAPLVTFLGRVHPGKGVEYLVPALAQSPCRDMHLAVIGPDANGYLAKMKALAAHHGVADRVVFTGMLKGQDRIAALSAGDIFALPSEHENFAIAVAEAMAAGKPVLVSPDVGIADDVVAADAGSVVPRDPALIGTELAGWIGDPARRLHAGTRAKAFARQRYDWLEIGNRWAGHYAGILGNSP